MSSGRWLALALPTLLWAGAGGCGRPEPEAAPLPEPWVSAVNAVPRSWHPLSAGTLAPEKLPGMVMYEVTVWPPERQPTPEQQRAAQELVSRCRDAAQRRGWFAFERAGADGFQPIWGDPTHFANAQYLFDDALLDPERPEVLMYANTNRGRKLAGFMFYVRQPQEHGPQIGGPLTLWHYHVWPRGACLLRGLIPVASPDESGRCASGELSHQSPEMLHVWLIDHPQGRFATNMSLPRKLLRTLLHAEEVEALEHGHGEHEGHAAEPAAHEHPAAADEHAGHSG